MMSALNARLLSAAELTRQGAVLADIGTDHAYLPLYLLSNGHISFAFATDVNEGPLASARANAEEYGHTDKMSFVLTDGATVLSDKGITDYSICGMGGELIADIIDRAPHLAAEGINLILQPMSRQEKLRTYLASHGFDITCESYSFDAGKYYVCMLAVYTGKCREISALESYIGFKNSSIRNKECHKSYLEAKIKSMRRALDGKKSAGIYDATEEQIIEQISEYIKNL